MIKHLFHILLLVGTIFICSCTRIQTKDPLVSHIDSTVRPGNNFFLFANGKWFKQNPIPASEANNGIWRLIQDTINSQIRNICISSSKIKNEAFGSNKQKIGDFYLTGMDSIALNKRGISEIKPYLDSIEGIKDINGLLKATALIHKVAGSPLFSFYVGQDDKISNKNAIFIWQGGLSLPDRSYYFDIDSRAVTIRKKFSVYIFNLFKMMGYNENESKKTAEHLLNLETTMAHSSRALKDTRETIKNYDKISFKKLQASYPNINWPIFIKEVGLKQPDTVILGQPEFVNALNGYLSKFPIADWKNYLKFHLIINLSNFMDDKTFMESFNFYAKTLYGFKEPKPRWKRVVEQTDFSLGELIGQVYVKEYLPKGTKEKLIEIGSSIKKVYAERIKALDWMSDSTKKRALKKLNALVMKLGYPDKWKDLSSMKIDKSSYLHNSMEANKWAFNYMISKYGKPVDRSEWNMTPQTYNAYYSDSNNEIVIPGCDIITPGYENHLADDAILYAVTGFTFGHEITHGFDDQGCKYDEKGNLNNWWTASDSIKFFNKTKAIVNQYNKYIAVDSLHINGDQTQGENIADLGGVIMSYEAFKNTNQYKKHEIISGLDPDQRFFLGYALGWMVNERPEEIANWVRSDVHSPCRFRVNGPLSNMPEFYAAFGIKKGDSLWKNDSVRVKIW